MMDGNMILNQIMNNPNMKNNPVMQNAIQMYQNGDTKGLQQLCENVCKTKGTSIEQMSQQVNKMFGN